MFSWLAYLKSGLSHSIPKDKLTVENAGGTTTSARLQNLRPYLVRHWKKGVVGAGLVLFVSLLTFPQPLIYRFLVDNVILAKRLDLLLWVLLLMGGIKLCSMGSGVLEEYYFTRYEQEVMLDLQHNLLDHALSLPKTFFDNKEVGYLVSRLSSDVQGLQWFFSSNIVYILSSGFRLLGGAIFLFYLEWRLGIVTLIVLPLLVWATQYFSKRMHALSHHGMERYAELSQRFNETLSTVPLIKAFVSEKRETGRVMDAMAASQQIEMEQTAVGSVANVVLGLVPSLASGVVLIVGVILIIRGQWTLGSLLAFQSYLGYVYGPAMSLSNANLQFQSARTALERVSAVLDIVPEEKAGTGRVVDHLRGGVQFDQVDFSFDGGDPVLQGISFQVRPGEHIAIAGPSGVGKTTLVSLLLRFYCPKQGKIFFDDVPAEEFDLGSLRRRIGYVSQSTLLLEGTVCENLAYGNPEASQEQIEHAAKVAGIHDFILGLPEGYEAIIGERGANLSEGQKQRISIARALVKDPDILILDEPTSALDSVVERSIFEALPDFVRGKTLFVVAHRPSTIKNADRVLLLSDRRLVAAGSHDQLMHENAYYRSLFQ